MSDNDTPRPDSPSGDTPAGNTPSGETERREKPAGDTERIDPPAGETPRDDAAADTPSAAAAPNAADAPNAPDTQGGAGGRPGEEWRPVPGAEPSATEQFPTTPIAPGAQAYSKVPPSEADTTDLGGHGLGAPGTSQFRPGEEPFASGPIESGPIDAPAGGPVITSPRKKRSTAKIVAFSLVGVLLLVVIGAVGSELYLRNKVTGCLEESFSGLTGVPTSVEVSRKPILLQGTGDIPFVQVDTDDSAAGVRLHMRADGISSTDNTTDIRTLTGNGFIPFERIIELSKEQAAASGQSSGGSEGGGVGGGGSVAVDQITGNAADGTFEVQASFPVMFFSVPVSATVKPINTPDGRVEFKVEKASALVFGIPPDFAQQIVDQVTTSALGPFFDEVQVDGLKVTDTGLEFAISGSDVQLTNEMTGSSSNEGGCSI
ncbi:hypothetical protein IA539_10580 [Gordonia sp. zg691]|uniref:DUF2993 domain-containing protein n=1 Tax=Gordonia jinghuaiqii TaxID=2758710 RepID=A0A7D7QYH9_9ACTN|nr:hypothetical protein [Gordonia jinghuaiqii]MBD0861651.1 hypothetical protein [Gordonia jinghuaiqii]MCR5977544.1 hypothetical protein [Gordonia jinghuaiqii]QMT02228.1 hypothetical protein H1R19_03380 [Gordonia jinghuaiqii]